MYGHHVPTYVCLDVEYKEVSLPKREHYHPEYMIKNPMHTIPMLEDDGFIVVDSHAIMAYLVSKYDDGNPLYPKDIRQGCMVDQRLLFDATILFPRLRTVIYSLATGQARGITDLQKKDIEEGYEIMEKYLQKTSHVAGNHLTVADLSCVTTVSSLNYVVPVGDKYVKLNQWWGKLKEEPWYLKKNVPGAEEFGFFMSSLLRR